MPLPITAPVSVPLVCCTICWAAARVSKLILFHCASRCSVIRRIFIFRPFADLWEPKAKADPSLRLGCQSKAKRPPEGGRYKFTAGRSEQRPQECTTEIAGKARPLHSNDGLIGHGLRASAFL